jgi:hypothetical protein
VTERRASARLINNLSFSSDPLLASRIVAACSARRCNARSNRDESRHPSRPPNRGLNRETRSMTPIRRSFARTRSAVRRVTPNRSVTPAKLDNRPPGCRRARNQSTRNACCWLRLPGNMSSAKSDASLSRLILLALKSILVEVIIQRGGLGAANHCLLARLRCLANVKTHRTALRLERVSPQTGPNRRRCGHDGTLAPSCEGFEPPLEAVAGSSCGGHFPCQLSGP